MVAIWQATVTSSGITRRPADSSSFASCLRILPEADLPDGLALEADLLSHVVPDLRSPCSSPSRRARGRHRPSCWLPPASASSIHRRVVDDQQGKFRILCNGSRSRRSYFLGVEQVPVMVETGVWLFCSALQFRPDIFNSHYNLYLNYILQQLVIDSKITIFKLMNYGDRVVEKNLGEKLIVGQFQIDPSSILGSGISSVVLNAKHEKTGVAVAAKLVSLSKISNEVQRILLHNEIKSLKCSDHPNIIKFLGCYQSQKTVYLFTEKCETELGDYIKTKGVLPVAEALQILMGLVEGYLHLEAKGIVHRDIKTSNIMMAVSGPKLIDFGFADHIAFEKPDIVYNVGSPAYMAPQAYYDNLYSAKSDVWALGIVFHEMLLGKTLNQAGTYENMVLLIEQGQYAHTVKGKAKLILKQCLAVNTELRASPQRLKQLLAESQGSDLRTSVHEQAFGYSVSSFKGNNFRLQNGQLSRPKSVYLIDTNPSLSAFSHYMQNERVLSMRKNETLSERHHESSGPLRNACHSTLNPNLSTQTNYYGLRQDMTHNSTVFNFHLSLVKLVFRLLKLLAEPQSFIEGRRKEYQYLLIRHVNTLMKKLRECLFAEKNLFHLENYREFMRHESFEKIKAGYEETHNLIKIFVIRKMEGLPVFEKIGKIFESIDSWLAADHLALLLKFIRGKALEIEAELAAKENASLNLSPGVQQQLKIIVFDYTLLYWELVNQISQGGLKEPQLESAFSLREVIAQKPREVSWDTFRLLRFKKRTLGMI